MLNRTLTPLCGFGASSKDKNVDATVIETTPTSPNITKAVYDYIDTLSDGDEVTSADIFQVIGNADPGAKLSNVAAAMFHLRNEGVVEVIKTVKPPGGWGRAYLYKITKSARRSEHNFRSTTAPRGMTRSRATMKERASQTATRITDEARFTAAKLIAEARTVVAQSLAGDSAPLSVMLGALADRAAQEEKDNALLVINARTAAEKPRGILLSEATLPQIIAEMARRM